MCYTPRNFYPTTEAFSFEAFIFDQSGNSVDPDQMASSEAS